MIDQNEEAKQRLVSLLKEKRAILLVGAGSSKLVDYPLLHDLMEEMGEKLTPSLKKRKDTTVAEYADMIKNKLEIDGRSEDYYNFLERRFEPRRDQKNHDNFHLALVKLGFCGIITTNYDFVLETAIMKAYINENGPFLCEALDLCQQRPYRIFDFLRGLSSHETHRYVLHIHGYYRNPRGIILTHKDYQAKYGERPTYDELGKPLSKDLDSLHRKLLWSLFVMHSLVFVGFSVEDEFFMHMLRVVQADFELGSDPTHFAILPSTSDEERERTLSFLVRNGITPVFYHVPKPRKPNDYADHSGLERLIFDLENSLGK